MSRAGIGPTPNLWDQPLCVGKDTIYVCFFFFFYIFETASFPVLYCFPFGIGLESVAMQSLKHLWKHDHLCIVLFIPHFYDYL